MNRDSAKSRINSRLLAVRGAVGRVYLPQMARLEANLQPKTDFAGQDVLPLLVLLPTLNVDEAAAVDLAAAMQLAFLAGRVHDLNADTKAERNDKLCGHAILVGDYLYAFAAVRLHNAGFDGWLDKVGRSLVRRSEARQQRLSWEKRPYVADEEKLHNLPKEHAEVVAVAAGLAAEAAEMNAEQAAAYAEFGFYLGILQGLTVYEIPKSVAGDKARAKAAANARLALSKLPELAVVAEEMLIEPLLAEWNGAVGQDICKNIYNKEEIG